MFFSGSYVYIQLFPFNGQEKNLNLFIAIKAKLLNLHLGAWEMLNL